jgi:RNA polymerase sigma-70 factor (ECF subfamily)
MGLDIKEIELIQGCKQGNSVCQREFYELHCRKVMGVCVRYLKDTDEAKDAMQETFIKAFEKIETFKGECQVEFWLRKIAVNMSLNKIRSNKRFITEDLSEYSGELCSQNDVFSKMSTDDILKAVHTLPEGARAVFNLKAIEGYGHAEIATMFGISEGTSKSQYARAKSYLQKVLSEKVELESELA